MTFNKKFLFGKKIEINLSNLTYKKKSVYFWLS